MTIQPQAPRGDGTRRRLLETGCELFARYGLDGVSTRRIAAEAGVNQAAIAYHFGGKAGLYLAIADDLVASVGVHVRAAAERVAGLDLAALPHQARLDAAETLIRDFARHVLAVGGSPARAGFILREQMAPGAAFERLYGQVMRPMHEAMSRLVAALTDEPPEAETSILRAHALIGQVVVFGLARHLLLLRLDRKELDDAAKERIVAILADTMRRALAVTETPA